MKQAIIFNELFDVNGNCMLKEVMQTAEAATIIVTDWKPSEENSQWWNLTEAIQEHQSLAVEHLDGKLVKCVHPKIGSLFDTLARQEEKGGIAIDASDPAGWDNSNDGVFEIALAQAWYGNDGWSLWVAGENPFKSAVEDHREATDPTPTGA